MVMEIGMHMFMMVLQFLVYLAVMISIAPTRHIFYQFTLSHFAFTESLNQWTVFHTFGNSYYAYQFT